MTAIQCQACGATLPHGSVVSPAGGGCPMCGEVHKIYLFPAAIRSATSSAGEAAEEGEATCFDHPMSRAVAACSECGRLLCGLCIVERGSSTVCPACLVHFGTGGSLEPKTMYDSIAFLTATFPMFFWPILFLTAPAAIFLSIRYWRKPLAMLHANRWRFVAAILVGLLQITGLGVALLYLAQRAAHPSV